MPDEGRTTSGHTEGGGANAEVKPPVSPPTATPPTTEGGGGGALLALAAGFASIGALLTFLLGCLGEGAEILVEIGVLLAVLSVVLDALAAHQEGGGGQADVQPPVSPPGFANITIGTILAALGLLAVLLDCVMSEEGAGLTSWFGLMLLLASAVSNFIAYYNIQQGGGGGD